MAYVLGIDIGGTFTDAFATSDDGRVASAKSPSTPPDFATGMIDAIRELAAVLKIEPEALLADAAYICHGTTSSLNALVTGNVAKVGYITTRGHADAITIMNLEGRYAGLGPDEIQNMTRTSKPKPLVNRRFVREIDERIDYKGAAVVALNEDVARRAISSLVEEGVEAIAVSLLWSFSNPAHERRVRELIAEVAPHLYVALSSDLVPRIREYPRSATTIMSTQVGPIVRDYLQPLSDQLKTMKFGGALLVMQGSGGTVSAQEAPNAAITTIGSVLTGGVIGCVTLGKTLGHKNIISTDMGGTTFLVGMVVDGQPLTAPSTVLNQHTVATPMVKIHTIGSGGGAIAWIDAGGNLRVGPRSAGALPGPAAYDTGGVEPTITDADIVLGIINPDFFLAGRKQLRRDLAEAAIRTKIAEPLKMSVEDAALAIYTIANAQAADLVRRAVVNAGYDPRDFVLYAFGGAGPVHCGGYAAELGAREVLIPLGSTASAFSAYGLAAADIVLSAELSNPRNAPVDAAVVNETFAALEADLRAKLDAQQVTFTHIEMRREIDIRFTLQLAEVATPVKNGTLSEDDIRTIEHDFEALYERLYGKGSGFREAGVQLITYRVFAVGHLPFTPKLPRIESTTNGGPRSKARRPVLLDPAVGWRDTPIFDYETLRAGHEITGPAIVEAPTTTVTVPANASGSIDAFGNMIIRYN